MKKNNNTNLRCDLASLDMELTIEGLGKTLRIQGTSLFIGNEYDTTKDSIYLEDISRVQNKELVSKIEELNKIVSERLQEVKELAIEAYKNEWMVEGELDEAEGVA